MRTMDLHNYWQPAVVALIGDASDESMTDDGWPSFLELDLLLGIDEYRKYQRRPTIHDYGMSEELKRLLIQLAGPHGKTILIR